MSFQTPITVKDTVNNIHSKKYLLPAIQRIDANCVSSLSKSDYMRRNFIPDIDLKLSNFPDFAKKETYC